MTSTTTSRVANSREENRERRDGESSGLRSWFGMDKKDDDREYKFSKTTTYRNNEPSYNTTSNEEPKYERSYPETSRSYERDYSYDRYPRDYGYQSSRPSYYSQEYTRPYPQDYTRPQPQDYTRPYNPEYTRPYTQESSRPYNYTYGMNMNTISQNEYQRPSYYSPSTSRPYGYETSYTRPYTQYSRESNYPSGFSYENKMEFNRPPYTSQEPSPYYPSEPYPYYPTTYDREYRPRPYQPSFPRPSYYNNDVSRDSYYPMSYPRGNSYNYTRPTYTPEYTRPSYPTQEYPRPSYPTQEYPRPSYYSNYNQTESYEPTSYEKPCPFTPRPQMPYF